MIAPPLLSLVLATASLLPSSAEPVIGVTLHPYYSWTAQVVGDEPFAVRALLPENVDAGAFRPGPEDIARLQDLDALVVNGLGHDDFVFDMLEASGNEGATVVRPNERAALLPAANGGEGKNSHTFLSLSNAIQQTYAIERALSAEWPAHAAAFRRNAGTYAKRLRRMKADAAKRLASARITRVVCVHDGYGYLMQELGLEVVGVVEPAHGLVPSAREMAAMVELLRREGVRVVFSEERFPQALTEVLEGAGARVYVLSHVATGAYTKERFEVDMRRNIDVLERALVTDASADEPGDGSTR